MPPAARGARELAIGAAGQGPDASALSRIPDNLVLRARPERLAMTGFVDTVNSPVRLFGTAMNIAAMRVGDV